LNYIHGEKEWWISIWIKQLQKERSYLAPLLSFYCEKWNSL